MMAHVDIIVIFNVGKKSNSFQLMVGTLRMKQIQAALRSQMKIIFLCSDEIKIRFDEIVNRSIKLVHFLIFKNIICWFCI